MDEHDESIIERHQQRERQERRKPPADDLTDPQTSAESRDVLAAIEQDRAETRSMQSRVRALERLLLGAGIQLPTAEEALTGQGLHVGYPGQPLPQFEAGLRGGKNHRLEQAKRARDPHQQPSETAPSFQPFVERVLRELNIADQRTRELRGRLDRLLRQGPQPPMPGNGNVSEPRPMPASALEGILDELGQRASSHRYEIEALLEDLVV